MKRDLLHLIGDESGITNVIVLTHNIDFVFIQNLVLNALSRCGSPSLTIFADAGCAAESFSLQAPLLGNLGTRYRVVPVAMERGFRFHPKAILLAGRKSARLLVGSGNLTFSGWRENGEIWVQFRSEDGTAEIAAFKSYLDGLVARLALNDTLKSEIEEAFDPATRSWAEQLDEPAGLVGRIGSGPPLAEAMLEALGEVPNNNLFVVCPYFDERAQALVGLHQALAPQVAEVLVDPRHTNLPPTAARDLPENLELRPAWIERPGKTGHRRRFLHAKIYAVERGDEVLALIGSANCSQAALTMTGDRGNAELLAVVRFDKREFEGLIKSELRISAEEALELTEIGDEPEEFAGPPGPVLLAARADDDVVRIAHSHPEAFRPERAVLGGNAIEIVTLRQGTCECLCPAGAAPLAVAVEGDWNGSPYRTPPLWIDHERHLLSTAYRRALEDTIRRKARQGEWGIGDWRQVLEVLCQDLEYSSPVRAIATGRPSTEEDGGEQPTFTRDDLFARDLRLQLALPGRSGAPSGTTSFQALLLRWFGHEPSSEIREDNADGVVDEDADEAVDRVERVVAQRASPEEEERRTKQDPRDRNKARKIVEQMTTLMSSAGYLETRRMGDLARDLQLAAVLLRLGSTKGWIEHEEVLSTTHRVWRALFLSAGDGDTQGWLHRRWQEDPVRAQEALGRPAVTAALFVWSLEIPMEPRTPRELQMLLSLALSVARHPWLWLSVDLAAVAEEVEAVFVASSDTWSSDEISDRWLQLKSLGRELWTLEQAVEQQGIARLRGLNPHQELAEGELVWQGALGYCVLKAPASRKEKKHAEVLLVQLGGTDTESKTIRSDFLNPVRGLAASGVIPGNKEMRHLMEFLRSVALGVPGGG